MTTTITLRDATADDVIALLRGSTYATTAETALGWGMGPAQNNISAAVDAAVATGQVRVVETQDTTYGRGVRFLAYVPEAEQAGTATMQATVKFSGPFTVTYVCDSGETVTRSATWRALSTILPVIGRMADRQKIHSIEVLDRHGNDVTFDSEVLPLVDGVAVIPANA